MSIVHQKVIAIGDGADPTKLQPSDWNEDHDLNFAWADYTPVWTALGTAPNIGNGTLVGRHLDIGDFLCLFRIQWVAGSTTTFGTSTWRFTLPHIPSANNPNYSWSARILDNGSDNKLASAYLVTSGDDEIEIIAEGANVVTNTSPHTWANTDTLTITGHMER